MNKNLYIDDVNGRLKRGNFENVNYFNGKKIEKKYIEELPNKTLIVLGKGYNNKTKIIIDKSVTSDILKSKEIIFYNKYNKIKANSEAINYIQANTI